MQRFTVLVVNSVKVVAAVVHKLQWYSSGTLVAPRVPHDGVSAYGFSVPPGLGEPGAFSPENFIIEM